MENKFKIYNTLNRKKETFVPLHAPHVGMYVCGPTVYGDGHLGHARPAITFDILFRFLTHLGFKVRYKYECIVLFLHLDRSINAALKDNTENNRLSFSFCKWIGE